MNSVRIVMLVLASLVASALIAEPLPTTRTIVLVRHGHYVADASDSKPGPGLSALGIAQARLTGARLAGMAPFDAILASPMTRAAETAKVIAEDLSLPIETVPSLAECTPRTRRQEIIAKESDEELDACAAQLDALFRTRFVPSAGTPRRELFVAHGNVTRYLVTRALGVDSTSWLEMSIAHASMTTILVEPDGRFKVIAVGDSGHLPPNFLTGATGMQPHALKVP